MYFWNEALPFIEAGLRLYSVTEGWIPWSTPEERVLLSMRLLSAHGKATSTSRDTTRGMLDLVARGGWPTVAPYGYRIVYHGGDGRHRGIPKLEPHPTTAKIVQMIFQRYAEGWSLRALVADLNARGVPPPRGPAKPAEGGKKGCSGLWSIRTLSLMLRN